MKNIYKIVFLIILFLFAKKVYAYEIEYSDWQEEFPYFLSIKFIESEDRYLWYKEEDGNVITTSEYYSYLEGYTRIDESVKTFYRYITTDYILVSGSGEIVYDESYCIKSLCSLVRVPDPPIYNPKTSDNIYIYVILFILSLIVFVIIYFYNQYSYNYIEE